MDDFDDWVNSLPLVRRKQIYEMAREFFFHAFEMFATDCSEWKDNAEEEFNYLWGDADG